MWFVWRVVARDFSCTAHGVRRYRPTTYVCEQLVFNVVTQQGRADSNWTFDLFVVNVTPQLWRCHRVPSFQVSQISDHVHPGVLPPAHWRHWVMDRSNVPACCCRCRWMWRQSTGLEWVCRCQSDTPALTAMPCCRLLAHCAIIL